MYQIEGGIARQTGQFRQCTLHVTVSVDTVRITRENLPVAPVMKMCVFDMKDVDEVWV